MPGQASKESSGSRSNALTVLKNGNVGFGTQTTLTHPTHMGSGAHVTAAGVWTDASDISRKENIRPLHCGLHTILPAQPVGLRLQDRLHPGIGCTAQDMKLVIPEVVSGEEGNQGIAYSLLTAVLNRAVQEQQKIIDSQARRMEAHESRIALQQQQFAAHERRLAELARKLAELLER